MIFNIPYKKFLIGVIVVILLFTPTYFAIGSYNANKADAPFASDLTQLTVKDPDGNTTTVTSDNDPNNVMELFREMMEESTRVSALPDDVSDELFLLATYKVLETEETSSYKYYFSVDPDRCYFTTPSGENFKIDDIVAKRFLASSFSIYLYDNAAPPVLSAGEGNTIVPSNISWHYLASGGIYREYKNTSTSETVLNYDVGSEMKFSFSVEPDVCDIKVYNGSATLFDGDYDKLPPLSITRNSTLTFVIDAQWKRNDNSQYYGEASYSFNANVTALAEFKLGSSTIQHGEFTVISGINVSDPTQVKFESSPAIDFTPIFYPDATSKDTVHALVPIKYTSANSGTYTFTVSYGVSQQTLTLDVKKNEFDKHSSSSTAPYYHFGTRNYAASKAQIDTNFTAALVDAAKNTFNTICSSQSTTRYFSGPFINYFNGTSLYPDGGSLASPHLLYGFGRELVLVNDNDRAFLNSGVEFLAKSYNIPATASGVVCATGFDEVMGFYVVIDHGYGLKSWYTNLGEVSATLNSTVQKGDVIAKGGGSGFIAKKTSARLMFTVGSIPVSPYSLLNNGVIFPTFEQ